jgi:hypothetical protein
MRRRTRNKIDTIYRRAHLTNTSLDNLTRRLDRIEWLLHNLQPNLREVLFAKPEQDLDEWYKDNKLNIERLASEGMA